MKPFILISLIAVELLCAPVAFAEVKAHPPLVFVINSAVNPLLNQAFVNETIETIRRNVYPRRLEVKYAELLEIEEMMEKKTADFYLATSSTVRRFQDIGLRDMVTASSPFSKDPNKSEGSLIIVDADRKDLNTIDDLKGKKAAAGRVTAFGMYLAAMGEVAKAGYNPQQFFSGTSFYGLDRDKIIEDVLTGKADVGILRICYLEDAVNRKVVDPTRLKFINLQPEDEHICLHSTALYPNWSIGSSPNLPAAYVSAVTAALIHQKPTALGIHWSVASDYTELDTLLRALNLGAYQRFSRLWFGRMLHEYKYVLLGAGAMLLLLLTYTYLVSKLVERRTRQLRVSLERENKTFQEAKAANERLLRMQRAGVVGQVSGLIAHELNQPLASIKLYARALQRASEAGTLTEAKMKEVLEEMRADADMASAIVDRVRQYAKGRDSGRQTLALSELAAKSIREFNRQTGSESGIVTRFNSRAIVYVNALEIELCIVNLLRNASEALTKQNIKHPKITVSIFEDAKRAELRICDNGNLSEEKLSLFNEPTQSDKSSGLGLGLQIVRGIVENHGGKISFSRNNVGGLSVLITLPLHEANHGKKAAENAHTNR
ncbi:sensor histidine kinase [uncultured Parasutterella sp.]|uniref:sensor histidine kinase n=1 Tax=uncultured Parasutterella sp. TaxID=1263098 RepID=UPI00259568FA|nr:sensor histidine kinase [uncultured Parasutterella sp.]